MPLTVYLLLKIVPELKLTELVMQKRYYKPRKQHVPKPAEAEQAGGTATGPNLAPKTADIEFGRQVQCHLAPGTKAKRPKPSAPSLFVPGFRELFWHTVGR